MFKKIKTMTRFALLAALSASVLSLGTFMLPQHMQQAEARQAFVATSNISENSRIAGRTPREILGNISQNDNLSETFADEERCGAAALLSAHYLLYGSFHQAFAQLNINATVATYRAVHLAQERLFNYANTDGQSGLTSFFSYTLYKDGRVENPVAVGETANAAKLIGMHLQPLIGQNTESFYQREEAVSNFWAIHPEAVLMLGVYMDENDGMVYPPNVQYPQNHYVLIFREDGRYWMLNSGVIVNGNGSALKPLSLLQINELVYQTTGSLDALIRA